MVCSFKNGLAPAMYSKYGGGYSSLVDAGYLVFALAGQSNMRGNDAIRPGVDDDYSGLGHVFMWDATTATVKSAINPLPHQDVFTNGCGMWLQFVRALPKTRKILLVPAAKGGSGFGIHWQPGQPIYVEAVARMTAAMATHPNNTFAAMIWHQGEQEASNQNVNHLKNLKDMRLAMIAANFGLASSTPFIVGSIHSDGTAWKETVNANLVQFAADVSAARYVNLLDLPMQGDNLHFTAAGLETMGSRYAAAFNNF